MPTKNSLVLDCSIALAWYFADEADSYADSVQDSLSQAEAFVPSLWPLEITNALVVGERRGRATVAQATTWLSLLRALPIRVDGETAPRAWTETLQLARTHGLTTYDASYLELALRLGCPIATLDKKLRGIATATGVPLFKAKR
jgi:predicted nucleic acid-binding protein